MKTITASCLCRFRCRQQFLSLLALCCGLLLSASDCCWAESEIVFNTAGHITSLKLNGQRMKDKGYLSGFKLRYFDGVKTNDIKMGNVVTKGDTIIVSESGQLPRFTFRIDTYDRHVSLHLIDVEGVAANRNYSLNLTFRADKKVGLKSLDNVVDHNLPFENSLVLVRWKHLWGQELDGTRGGIAMYNADVAAEELDRNLAEIWVTEGLPKPAGQTNWTESDVLKWVERYAASFGQMTEVILEAASEQELYELTEKLVFPNDVKRVYLHTKTWRGEYWPDQNSRVHVNTAVFPKGKDDLKRYSEYLRQKGVFLRLHSVSCGIGRNDPNYVVGTVDRRLASWGAGKLEQDVAATDKTILFRPAPETKLPVLARGSSHIDYRIRYEFLRIEEEIVQVGSFRRTDEDVWVLENCVRGYKGTDAAGHQANSEMVGLYCPYRSNFIPEYDLDKPNSLMKELAHEYADFVNELQLGHLHFDGPEIHITHPWANRDLFDYIYSLVDHPVTSSRVGKRIAANFEQRFSAVKDDRSYDYFPLEIGIRLDGSLGKPATGILDTSFHIQESVMLGTRRVFLSVPQSGFGITTDLLQKHGQSNMVIDLFNRWREVAPVLHQDDVDYIGSVTTREPGVNHYESEYVLLLGKNSEQKYTFTPWHVMGRSSGEDLPYRIEQEKGAVARKQTIKSGDVLELENPNSSQLLKFIVRVDHKGDASLKNPKISIKETGSLFKVDGVVAPGQYLQYSAGKTCLLYDENWKLISKLPVTANSFKVVEGGNTIKIENGESGSVNLEVQFLVKGEVYVLKTNELLK